ncbi:hypothetical protein KC19_N019000 [Ceratodon purpureus]|nr:hypothetical protein KC19_N019000 [Ceratodon purpureus]
MSLSHETAFHIRPAMVKEHVVIVHVLPLSPETVVNHREEYNMGVVDEDLGDTDAAHQALLTVLMVNAARKTLKQNSLAASRSCILSEHDHLHPY